MNVFTEISTRELENTLKGKAVHYIVNDAGEGLCLFFEAGRTTPAQTTVTLSTSARSLMQLASRSLLCSMSRKRNGPKTAKHATTALWVSNLLAA
jgi:hypothetical protein